MDNIIDTLRNALLGGDGGPRLPIVVQLRNLRAALPQAAGDNKKEAQKEDKKDKEEDDEGNSDAFEQDPDLAAEDQGYLYGDGGGDGW